MIGAELSFGRAIHQQPPLHQNPPYDLFAIELTPALDWQPQTNNQWGASLTCLVNLGVQAYLTAGGRVTPEEFAAIFQDDPGAATPAFAFDGLHTTQELLKEGLHPRLSGLHNAPSGLITACMPAVGIFHLGDPERAYLDGIELASVNQPRLGADWAALGAAALAAAFLPGASAASVVETTLKLAHAHSPDLFYQLDHPCRSGAGCPTDEGFNAWWLNSGGVVPEDNQFHWILPNPLRFALPVIARYAHDPVKLFQTISGARLGDSWAVWTAGWLGVHPASAVIAGAVCGALNGEQIFPSEWRQWAEPIAQPWYALGDLVNQRLHQEQAIVKEIESLARPTVAGDVPLFDRLKGALLAGAIGNAMGSPVEAKMYWEIDQQYPEHVLSVLDPRRLESEDDNQMAMLLVETYLERDGLPVMARHFGHTWQTRLNRDHFFPLCMGNAYDLIRSGMDARVTGHWSVVTGSTVMCMEPVGMFNLGDPAWAVQDATAISYMYQRGLDVTCAAMLAATVANALRPGATVESVLQAVLEAAPRTPLRTFDVPSDQVQRTLEVRHPRSCYDYIQLCLEIADGYDDVLAARKELYERSLRYHSIDPLELWGWALAMFKISRGDVRQAAIGGTNIGRDSDTIAGRAAMLAGALHGTRGIPAEWVSLFSPAALERIDRNAAWLTELISQKKINRMKIRLQVLDYFTPGNGN